MNGRVTTQSDDIVNDKGYADGAQVAHDAYQFSQYYGEIVYIHICH